MLGRRLSTRLTAGVLGLAMLAASSLAMAADVSDQAAFFSEKAIEKANTSIRDIEKRAGHDIRIETHSAVPSAKADEFAKLDKEGKNRFMNDWVHARAKELKENGSLILVCKTPGRVETWFSKKLADAGMSKSDRDDVTKAMLDGMGAKEYDKALDDTVAKLDSIYSKLKTGSATAPLSPNHDYSRLNHPQGAQHPAPAVHHENAPAAQQQHAPMRPARSSWGSVFFLLVLVVGGIFVISLISRLFSGNRGNGGPGGYGQPGYGQPGNGGGYGQPGYGGGGSGGGGGFMRGLAGGVFGAMAGNWLYDSMGGRSAHAHESSGMNQGDDPLSNSHTLGGGDSGNSGGGWTDDGSSGGGGWFGGGDSGGGDSGGGDFGGGGGGDSGGGDSGGGDF